MPAYTVRPGAIAGAAVIVLQEAYGVNAHIQDVCHRFAAKGFLAVAPHLYHRTGDPDLAYDDFPAVGPHMQALSRDDLVDDLDATLAWLDDQGFGLGRVGVVGFCMGGSIALFAAVTYPLGAAVTFYGGGVTRGRFGFPPLIELAPGLASPWLGLYGDNDKNIPAEQVEALRAAAKRAGVPHRDRALSGCRPRLSLRRAAGGLLCRSGPRRLGAHHRLVAPVPSLIVMAARADPGGVGWRQAGGGMPHWAPLRL